MALKDISSDERKIIGTVLDNLDKLIAAQKGDLVVSVYDGEEWSYKQGDAAYDRKAVEKVVGITEATILRVRHRETRQFTDMHFYHGNGEDVLSDMADSAEGGWIGDALQSGL